MRIWRRLRSTGERIQNTSSLPFPMHLKIPKGLQAIGNSSSEKGPGIIAGHELNMSYQCCIKRHGALGDVCSSMTYPGSPHHLSCLFSAGEVYTRANSGIGSSCQKGGSNTAVSMQGTVRMIRGLQDMTYKGRLKELGYLA